MSFGGPYEVKAMKRNLVDSTLFDDALLILMKDFADAGELDPNQALKTFLREALNAFNAFAWLTGEMRAAKFHTEKAIEFLG